MSGRRSWKRFRLPGGLVLAISAVAGACGPEADLVGPLLDPYLGSIEEALDPGERAFWPGVRTMENGRLVQFVQRYNGFSGVDGEPAGYWFLGPAPRRTADVLVMCSAADAGCPLDEHGRLAWERIIGNPIFEAIPGRPGYSPFWRLRVVRVPEGYAPNAVKSFGGLAEFAPGAVVAERGLERDFGPNVGFRQAIVHLPLVLEHTRLEDNARETADGQPSLLIDRHAGWHDGYRVHFFDFSRSEGPLPASHDLDGIASMRPLVPTAEMDLLARRCEAEPPPEACRVLGRAVGRVYISERSVELDLSGDGDRRDTNNVLSARPGGPAPQSQAVPDYSPLHRVLVAEVAPAHDSAVALVDTSGDPLRSDITTTADLLGLIARGIVTREPLSGAAAGIDAWGIEGAVFFDCPGQVAWGHVPRSLRPAGDRKVLEIGLGTRTTGFLPASAGAEVEMHLGPQGGHHINLAVRVLGVDMESDTERSAPVEVVAHVDGIRVGGYHGSGEVMELPDGRSELLGIRVLIDHDKDLLVGQDVTFYAFVADDHGQPVRLPNGDPAEGRIRLHAVLARGQ